VKKTWQLKHIIMMHFGNGDKLNDLHQHLLTKAEYACITCNLEANKM